MSNSFWCSMCGINLYHLVKKSVGSVEYEGQKSIRKYIIHTYIDLS
jgi:ribosomal protein L37E